MIKIKNLLLFLSQPNNLTPTGANEIRSILKISNNKFYVGTQKDLFDFNQRNDLFTRLKTVDDKYIGQVNSMIEDQQGYVWFVTSRGLLRQ